MEPRDATLVRDLAALILQHGGTTQASRLVTSKTRHALGDRRLLSFLQKYNDIFDIVDERGYHGGVIRVTMAQAWEERCPTVTTAITQTGWILQPIPRAISLFWRIWIPVV